jgi:hypothetical protein
MSGTRAPAGRGATLALRLPRVGARYDAALLNTALDLTERADATNVKTGQQPAFAGIILLSAPSQIGYLLTIDDAGALHVEQLPAQRQF